MVATLGTIEYATGKIFGTGVLEASSGWLAKSLMGAGGANFESPLKQVLKDSSSMLVGTPAQWLASLPPEAIIIGGSALGVVNYVQAGLRKGWGLAGDMAPMGIQIPGFLQGPIRYGVPLLTRLGLPAGAAFAIAKGLQAYGPGLAEAAVGGALMIGALIVTSKAAKALMTGAAKKLVSNALGKSHLAAMGAGTLATGMVQSSSVTTSLAVPLAAIGVVTLPAVYALTLGANVGTTFTALMSAMAVTGVAAVPSLQVALVHTLFNLTGAVVGSIKQVKNSIVAISSYVAELAAQNRGWALLYGAIFVGWAAGTVGLGRMWGAGKKTPPPPPEDAEPADAQADATH
jgi:hypothetical protein